MALLNKRSRNIEGLLASRLGDQDAPRKLQERGVHGALTSDNKVRYGTKDQEGRNFLKAVDRYHNRDDWNKDLGGGQNFMYGPTGASSDYVDPLMRMGAARKKLLEDPENELDRNEMDSEALDEWHQDQASDKKEKMDAITEVEGPDQMDEMVAQSGVEKEGSTWDTIKDYAGQAGDAISGLFDSDDEEGKKAFGKALTNKAMGVGDPKSGGGGARMDSAKTVAGKVAFPGLLQQQPKRQRTPYFMPKGLV